MHGIRIIRYGGLGDVAMALCTTKALKEEQNLYVEFFTDPIYKDLVKACPYVDCIFTDHEEMQALLRVPVVGHRYNAQSRRGFPHRHRRGKSIFS